LKCRVATKILLMDSRTTLKNNGNFIEILSACLKEKSKVAMLLDNNGLVRAEGFVKSIITEAVQPPYVEMEGGLRIVLSTITAVNGIFVASYAEC
jgi:hypothetical protein